MSRVILLLVALYLLYELFQYLKRRRHRARFQAYSSPDQLIAKADKAFRGGELHDARTYLQRAQILDSQSAEICNKLGVVHELLGEYADALKQFRQALHSDSHNEQTHLAVADLLSRMQHYDDARMHYARAIEIDGDSDKAYYSFARMLELSGDAGGACEKYRKALQLNPSHTEAQAALIRCGG